MECFLSPIGSGVDFAVKQNYTISSPVFKRTRLEIIITYYEVIRDKLRLSLLLITLQHHPPIIRIDNGLRKDEDSRVVVAERYDAWL